jgi:integrase
VLIRAGLSIKVIQRLLGHKSATETLDTYGHLMGDEDDRSREAIRMQLGNLATSCGQVRPLSRKSAGQRPGCGWAGS